MNTTAVLAILTFLLIFAIVFLILLITHKRSRPFYVPVKTLPSITETLPEPTNALPQERTISLSKSSEIEHAVESGHPDSWVNAAVGMDDEAAQKV